MINTHEIVEKFMTVFRAIFLLLILTNSLFSQVTEQGSRCIGIL